VGKAVGFIFDVVTGTGVAKGMMEQEKKGGWEWSRLALGIGCILRYEAKVKNMSQNLEAMRGFLTGLNVQE
jgi:hypothetical protein